MKTYSPEDYIDNFYTPYDELICLYCPERFDCNHSCEDIREYDYE